MRLRVRLRVRRRTPATLTGVRGLPNLAKAVPATVTDATPITVWKIVRITCLRFITRLLATRSRGFDKANFNSALGRHKFEF